MDLWFGDSWPSGFELGSQGDSFDNKQFPNIIPGKDNPLKAFPHHVSSYRKKDYINFAKRGSSIDFSLNQLISFCSTDYESNKEYTAFLCTTAQVRGYGKSFTLNEEFDYYNKFTKTRHDLFIYDSIVAISAFRAVCEMHNITCFIVPVFCDLIIPSMFDNLVLFKDRLLTKTSLVEETFNIKFVNDSYGNFSSDEEEPCSIYDWIKPNGLHPNIIGHRKLAYKLIELIECNRI